MSRSGFGSIRKLPSGRYQARYTYNSYPVKAPLTFDSKKEAENWLTLQKAAILTGDLTLNKIAYRENRQAEDMTLRQLMDKWLETKKREIAYSSFTQTQWNCDRLERDFEGKTVQQINENEIKAWVDSISLKLKKGTVVKYITLMKQIMRFAVDKGVIAQNPVSTGLLPKKASVHRTRYTLEEGELEKLVAVSQESFKLFIYLGAVLGLRKGEILGLKPTDLKGGALRIRRSWGLVGKRTFGYKPTKTEGSNRDVPVPDWLAKKWEEHAAKFALGEVMFPGRDGKPLGLSPFNDKWNRVRKGAGVNPKLHFHDLRGYAATEFVKKGATEREVMALLGHTSTQVSLSYQKATLSALSEVMDGRRKA